MTADLLAHNVVAHWLQAGPAGRGRRARGRRAASSSTGLPAALLAGGPPAAAGGAVDPALAADRGGAYRRTGTHIRHGNGGRRRGRRVGGRPCHRPSGRTLACRPLDVGAGTPGRGGDRAPGVDRAGPAAARPPRPHGGPDRASGGRPGTPRPVPRVSRLRAASGGPDALQFRPVPADGHVAGRLRPPRTGVSTRPSSATSCCTSSGVTSRGSWSRTWRRRCCGFTPGCGCCAGASGCTASRWSTPRWCAARTTGAPTCGASSSWRGTR